MALTVNGHVDDFLKREFGVPKYTTSGSSATIPTTTSVSHEQLLRLLDVARATGHRVSVSAGAFTVKPA